MKEIYRDDLKAHVTIDGKDKVRAIHHTQEFWQSDEASSLAAAISYFHAMSSIYSLTGSQLANMHQRVSHLDPMKRGVEYRLSEQKTQFDSTTVGFAQNFLNTPVWRAGLKVTVKHGPNRVIRSVDTSHLDVQVTPPSQTMIKKLRRWFARAELARQNTRAGIARARSGGIPQAEEFIRSVFRAVDSGTKERAERDDTTSVRLRLIRGRFWIYQYDESTRAEAGAVGLNAEEAHKKPFGPLPPVHRSIKDGQHYFVAEMTFTLATEFGPHNWRVLVEPETRSVLYLRALAAATDAKVFEVDPITSSGTTNPAPSKDNSVLNPHRDDVVLQRLYPPEDGIQSLKGEYAKIINVKLPNILPPTKSGGAAFEFDARTNDFAAVSAYFHVDKLFNVIEGLGWSPLEDYFIETVFPVTLDHRGCENSCPVGTEIGAYCHGDGSGGIERVEYMLNDNFDASKPVNVLGRAAAPRVHWHEVCGHGVLLEHVDDLYLVFAHSAGDGISGIFYDPESNVWGVDGTPLGKPGNLRFTYAPWRQGSLNRRFDRDVACGWAWGGSHDDRKLGSEEILATTNFRIYRSIGGDSECLGRRQFASRMMIYLILRAIYNLTPASNPDYARGFAEELMTVDKLNWTSEGIDGGAYNKVIRWAFEKQGEYQAPLVVKGIPPHGSIMKPGDAPAVDVYIDDGRQGEYLFEEVYWNTTTIWNRRAPDGMPDHEPPALGEVNYAYVKIKNRGSQQASDVVVRGYHTKPGAGLLWPDDFEAFTTAQIFVGTVDSNNTEEVLVGPFEWTPNINGFGHDCMLMIVSADADVANTDNLIVGEVIPTWRLVPNDNNIAQRNVNPIPGGGGAEGLMQGLGGVGFWVGNPGVMPAVMDLKVELPEALKTRHWRLLFDDIDNNRFQLRSGQKQKVVINLQPGRDFTRDDVLATAERDIQIRVFAHDNLVGGMTYKLDPDLARPINLRDSDKIPSDCKKEVKALLEGLGVKGKKVERVQIKEITLGVRLDEDGNR